MRSLTRLALALSIAMLAACGGAGNVGDPCERPGSTEDCVDGAICAQDQSTGGTTGDPVWDTYTCRAICVTQDDCGAGLECRGVSGATSSTRACQPFRDVAP